MSTGYAGCLLGLLIGFTASPDGVSDPSVLADIRPAPEVKLIDQEGKPFSLAQQKGKAVLVSFVYTTCGGTCPATTHRMYRVQQALREAGLWGKQVTFVSITLDPERDTPEVLKRYAEVFDADLENWRFLTGAPERVNVVIDAWDMWVKRNEQGVLDHRSRIFLIDPNGHEREIYNLEFLRPESVVRDVRGLLGEADDR